jgi:hypothetical protein
MYWNPIPLGLDDHGLALGGDFLVAPLRSFAHNNAAGDLCDANMPANRKLENVAHAVARVTAPIDTSAARFVESSEKGGSQNWATPLRCHQFARPRTDTRHPGFTGPRNNPKCPDNTNGRPF